MKKLTWLFGVAVLVLTLSVASYPLEMKGMFGLGAQGGLWKPVLTDHSDFWSVGPHGGVTLKYGILKNLAIGVTGTYAYTWEADLTPEELADGAGFTLFSKRKGVAVKDSARTYENILVDLAVYYYFMPEKKFTPYIFGGPGISIWKWKQYNGNQLTSDSSFTPVYDKNKEPFDVKDQEITAVVGVGIEYYPIENLGLNIGGKFRYNTRLLTSFTDDKDVVGTEEGELDLPRGLPEAFVGINYYFGKPKDTDKDGVPEVDDQCPDTPLGCLVDASGCPTDADNDGICDGLDKCPGTAKGCRVDATGCPTDADKDGVCDGLDKCADTPAGVKVDASGCPMDMDADGVADYKDKCADTPKGCKVDDSGCQMDADMDGVCDGVDMCANTPAGIEVDASGCPKVKPIEEKLTLHIMYKPGSAEIDQANMKILDDYASRLMVYQDAKIEVGGYTDATGTASANKKLSQKRAEKVKEYLVKKGISADRITAVGYGATGFIADNETAEGRQKNRRVEIVKK